MVAALGFILLTANVFAATVTNTNDSGPGSLREALASTQSGGTIDFSLSNCPCTITLTSGELLINKDLIVRGPGADLLTISGGSTLRVLHIEGLPEIRDINVEISGVCIAGGRGGTAVGYTFSVGGGIFNKHADTKILNSVIANNSAISGGGVSNQNGILRVISSRISGNSSGFGGGVETIDGRVEVWDSRFTENVATGGMGAGGGAIIALRSTVNIRRSTISRNKAVWAGGVWLFDGNSTADISHTTIDNNQSGIAGAIGSSGILNLTDSTITGNTGGSVYARGRTSISSCTIVHNSDYPVMGGAIIPGGVVTGPAGDITIRNSIVALNESGDLGHMDDPSGLMSSEGYNLIGDPRQFASAFTQTGDQIGNESSPLDPRLLPLADNGGTTMTHALRLDSPAVDRGFAFGETQDQVGYARCRDFDNIDNGFGSDGTDIGAVELVINEWIWGRVVTPSGLGLRNAKVTIVHLNGNRDTVITSSLGYFLFPAMLADGMHRIQVQSKRYRFAQEEHDFTGDVTEIEFWGVE